MQTSISMAAGSRRSVQPSSAAVAAPVAAAVKTSVSAIIRVIDLVSVRAWLTLAALSTVAVIILSGMASAGADVAGSLSISVAVCSASLLMSERKSNLNKQR